jgi:hypothetical protein
MMLKSARLQIPSQVCQIMLSSTLSPPTPDPCPGIDLVGSRFRSHTDFTLAEDSGPGIPHNSQFTVHYLLRKRGTQIYLLAQ